MAKDIITIWKENWDKLEAEDKQAKDQNQLVGRYITEPYADGKAVYIITKENKKTVDIEVVTGIGDDWVIPYWGKKARINKKYAIDSLFSRDKITAIFS